jgi:hypothetical protein
VIRIIKARLIFMGNPSRTFFESAKAKSR